MKKIIVYGWQVGFNKVGFTKLLRSEFGYPLSKANNITDDITENRPITIEVEDDKFLRLATKPEEVCTSFCADGEGF